MNSRNDSSLEVPPALFGAYLEDLRQLSVHWGEAQVLVAQLDGRIAGSVLFYADASSEGLGLPRGWAGFRKLAVHPALRGRGLGRSLTEHCVENGRQGWCVSGRNSHGLFHDSRLPHL